MRIIGVEEQIIKKTIAALWLAGYSLGVNDGDETTVERSMDTAEVFRAMKTTDEDYLLVYRRGEIERFGWVRFVYGNADHEVISDYTTNLEPVMKRINRMIDEYTS